MSIVTQELHSLPQVWLQAADLASDFARVLPATGQRVALFGCHRPPPDAG